MASAAPSHKGDSRTATAWEDSTGVTDTGSCNPAPQLLRAVPSIWICAFVFVVPKARRARLPPCGR